MKRAILATGGMDSTVLAYKSVLVDGIRPQLISVDYGHAAFAKQLEMLQHHVNALQLDPVLTIPVTFNEATPGLFTGAGVQDDTDNPFGTELFQAQDMRYKENFIEGRNLIMLAYCMAWASANKVDELWVGYVRGPAEWENCRSYRMITGDNSPQFVDMLNLIAFTGFSHQVRIRAPYYEQRLSKTDVAVLGHELGVNFNHTHSCYWPEACGKCDNCLLRAEALEVVSKL